ncbi:imidazole glycerol phosphate synthase subunit HisH [Acidobacteriota bacterium]
MTVGIVDYGAGNLRSVKKALDYLGAENRFIRKADDLGRVQRLILPGVGAFGHAIEKIRAGGLEDPLKEWLHGDRPFLGICLGLQLLFASSNESPGVDGLGFLPGHCEKFTAPKIPQIGWNAIEITQGTPLLEGISPHAYFYFVHSYYVIPQHEENVIARTYYFEDFVSIACRGNVCGVQFHPEKSGRFGLKFLQNWIKRC